MDILDHSDDDEEQSQSARLGSRFGKRRAKQRYVGGGHQHLLLMDCVGGSDNGDASEETVPLPDYERLSQSARLPDDDPGPKDPPPPLTQVQPQPQPPQQQQTPAKREPSSPQPTPTQQQKPAAWRLIDYVRSRNKAGGGVGGGGGDGAAGGCGGGSDGDSKSSDGDKESEDGSEEGKDKKKKKKRSSWLPDPDRRWPVQGFY